MYRYNPDGNLKRYRYGLTQLLQLNHTFSTKTFLNAGITHFKKSYQHRTYDRDKWDRYVHPKLLNLSLIHI